MTLTLDEECENAKQQVVWCEKMLEINKMLLIAISSENDVLIRFNKSERDVLYNKKEILLLESEVAVQEATLKQYHERLIWIKDRLKRLKEDSETPENWEKHIEKLREKSPRMADAFQIEFEKGQEALGDFQWANIFTKLERALTSFEY
jgi:hypothetical protein